MPARAISSLPQTGVSRQRWSPAGCTVAADALWRAGRPSPRSPASTARGRPFPLGMRPGPNPCSGCWPRGYESLTTSGHNGGFAPLGGGRSRRGSLAGQRSRQSRSRRPRRRWPTRPLGSRPASRWRPRRRWRTSTSCSRSSRTTRPSCWRPTGPPSGGCGSWAGGCRIRGCRRSRRHRPPRPPRIPAVPAIYTYFGQFVDHDITFEQTSLTLDKLLAGTLEGRR
jgi:hypothetical protein